ncbi:unnamed protein product [Parascedosporium putredinis]|uniref:pyridoxal 5'-phosphate synthase n=1 Tax=Parascedosporium putredinis TaxID=1442378 RepID=A0A9P1M5C2_9PEZI|nr:unnamed protein product [Parascedosporium putredinis]CAI7987939.1 unnamed protein product [Parascedosporium putredinis]
MTRSVLARIFRNVRMALHPPQEEKLIYLDPASPIPQFHNWYRQARAAALPAPQTCVLSTASLPSGRVSSRVVYLKELDADGAFVIYSNFGTSRKARDLETNPCASLVFWWEPSSASQAYFDTRERASRVGAWASKQSLVLEPKSKPEVDGAPPPPQQGNPARPSGKKGRKINSRTDWVHAVERRFEGHEQIPCPDFWGGLRIVPDRVEFWQGRKSRLHDRFVYERDDAVPEGLAVTPAEAKWKLNRLSP